MRWAHSYLTLIKANSIYLLQSYLNGNQKIYIIRIHTHLVRYFQAMERTTMMITNWDRKPNGKMTCKEIQKPTHTINFRLVYAQHIVHCMLQSILFLSSHQIYLYINCSSTSQSQEITNINISFVACTVSVCTAHKIPYCTQMNIWLCMCVCNKRSDSFFGRHTKHVFLFLFLFSLFCCFFFLI